MRRHLPPSHSRPPDRANSSKRCWQHSGGFVLRMLHPAAHIAPSIAGCGATSRPRLPALPARLLRSLAARGSAGSPRGVFRVDCDTPTLPSRSPLPKAAAASRVPALPLRSLAIPNAAGDTQGGLRLHFDPSASLSRSPTWDLAATSYLPLPAPPAHPLRLLAAPKAAGSTQGC
ncbi:hypothetical protein M422DRAFT_247273 [Sphaerobolus stellatus SS14]|nr:hypothetical protein M422DRAFT_247273 [Sphaerobolus stellatus SS14]